jgi:hypothetical protein
MCTVLFIVFLTAQPVLAQDPDPTEQTTALLDDELRTVYLGNLARQEHGVPPLRWPSERVPAFGYQGRCGAENAVCGYVTPELAIGHTRQHPGFLGF